MTSMLHLQTLLLLAENKELRPTIAAHIGMLDQLETILHRSVLLFGHACVLSLVSGHACAMAGHACVLADHACVQVSGHSCVLAGNDCVLSGHTCVLSGCAHVFVRSCLFWQVMLVF